jgi:hypothetical protein
MGEGYSGMGEDCFQTKEELFWITSQKTIVF